MGLFRKESMTIRNLKKHGTGCTMMFGLAIGSLGMVFFIFAVLPLFWQVMKAQLWVETPCTIIECNVESHLSREGTTYSVAVAYEYQVANPKSDASEMENYKGRRYNFETGSSSGYDSKLAIVNKNPPGSQRTCWVNPRDPSEAVLDRGISGMMYFVAAFLLIFPVVGYGLAFFSWRFLEKKGYLYFHDD